MAFEPNKITKEHVLAAIEKIEQEGILLINSTRWMPQKRICTPHGIANTRTPKKRKPRFVGEVRNFRHCG